MRATELYKRAAPRILDAMRAGSAQRTAAGLAGVSPAYLHKWITEGERDPDGPFGDFAVQVRILQAEQIAAAENEHRAARVGNPNALQWYLARMDRHTYGDEPQTVVVEQRPELPDASPDDIARALGKR
jgi:hypothetical protein